MLTNLLRHTFRPCARWLLFFLGVISLIACNSSGPQRKILVIHSYEREYTGYKDIEEKIMQAFEKEGVQAEIRHFYLDCERFLAEPEKKRMYSFMDTIDAWQPEIIWVNDDQATYSLLACNHPLVEKIPIVFAGVNFPNWPLIKRYPNVTGWWDKLEYIPLIRMIDRLFGPMRVRFWLDDTYLNRQATRRLLEDLTVLGVDSLGATTFTLDPTGGYTLYTDSAKIAKREGVAVKKPKEMRFVKVDPRNTTSAGFLWELTGLSRNTISILSSRSFTSIRIGTFTNNPTMTVINKGFGRGEGILGGYFTPLNTQIRLGVQTVTEILKGKNVQDIPITESPKEYLMDWKEMVRWDIPRKQVPSAYRIINMPWTERYKIPLILIGSVAGTGIVILIGYLLHLYRTENRKKHQAEEELRKGERFLSLALAGGKVFAFQIKDGFFHFNPDFYATVGMQARPISMEEFRTILSPEDRPSFNQRINSALNGSVIQRIGQGRYNFNESGYQWWEFRYAYNEEDQTITGLCLNIQALKETEQALIQARKKAEESDKMKSAFLANMSHEIRTPLNAIVGFSNLINTEEMELTAEERHEFLELINQNCDLLLKLISDILDLSRIESGRMDFVFDTYNLTELMHTIYQTHRLLMPDGVELQIRTPEEPVFLKTDQHRFTQVVTNLINNASKFTEKGYIRIGYELATDSREVHVYVEDSGKGIPKAKQQAIFERFNKLDEFAQGTGLGLAICQVIVQRLEGTIHLQSEEGVGSRFTVIHPFIN